MRLGICVLLLLTTTIFSPSLQHKCVHDQMEHDIKVSGPEYKLYDELEGRVLQQYSNINILLDYSAATKMSSKVLDYIQNSIMPPVMNYLQSTIQVPTRSSRLKAGGFSALCNGAIAVPSSYNKPGVNYDLIIFVKGKIDSAASYLAAGSSCLLDSTTYRPTVGQITYNLADLTVATSDADRESDIITTLHELTHVLGFSGALFQYYINPNTGAKLTNHISSKTIMGYTTTILNLPTLTSLIQDHFGCPSLPGAYMENQGGSGSAGSHFERRVFYNEFMTASSIVDTRVSKFTLAVLEGSGWYKVDYNKAEPMTWGRNEGCNFYQGACYNKTTQTANFNEFCSTLLNKGCSWTNRAGASCGAFQITRSASVSSATNWWGNYTVSGDSFSDNCPVMIPYTNLDCEDTKNAQSATISAESFGYGSKCFMGTLYPRAKLSSPFPYCFKSQCQTDESGKYYVNLIVGSNTVTCKKAGTTMVSGYGGVLYCPDPDTFCQQNKAEGNCRRACSARGTCINSQCACVEGWSGFDCSQQNYLDNCARCANGNPWKTSCYGDTCACNPANITCMCKLGLTTGDACLSSSDATDTDVVTDDSDVPVVEIPTTSSTGEVLPSTSGSTSTSDNGTDASDNVDTPSDSSSSNTSGGSSSNDPATSTNTSPSDGNSSPTTSSDTASTGSTSNGDSSGNSNGSSTSNDSSSNPPSPTDPNNNPSSSTDPEPNSGESSATSNNPTSSSENPTNPSDTTDTSLDSSAVSDSASDSDSSAHSLNHTTIEEFKGGDTLTDKTIDTTKEDTSSSHKPNKTVILSIVSGVLGGILLLIGIFFIVKKIRYPDNTMHPKELRPKLRARNALSPTTLPAELMTDISHVTTGHSPQGSPCISRNRLTSRGGGESPLTLHSPLRKNYTKSRFRDYSPGRDRFPIIQGATPDSASLPKSRFAFGIKPVDVDHNELHTEQHDEIHTEHHDDGHSEHHEEGLTVNLHEVMKDLESPGLESPELGSPEFELDSPELEHQKHQEQEEPEEQQAQQEIVECDGKKEIDV